MVAQVESVFGNQRPNKSNLDKGAALKVLDGAWHTR